MGAFLSHTRCDSSPDYEMLRYALGTLASGEPEEKKKNVQWDLLFFTGQIVKPGIKPVKPDVSHHFIYLK